MVHKGSRDGASGFTVAHSFGFQYPLIRTFSLFFQMISSGFFLFLSLLIHYFDLLLFLFFRANQAWELWPTQSSAQLYVDDVYMSVRICVSVIHITVPISIVYKTNESF